MILGRRVLIFLLWPLAVWSAAAAQPPPVPTLALPAREPVNGRSFRIDWTRSPGATAYEVQEDHGNNFSPPAATFWPGSNSVIVGTRSPGEYSFRVRAWKKFPQNGGTPSAWSNTIQLSVLSDAEFLDLLARKTFDYLLATTHANGLTRDRYAVDGSPQPVASIAASGFYLSALAVGAERGWMSISEAESRARTALQTFRSGTPTVRGFYYHFLNPDGTPSDIPFREVSSIDTALLMAGALQAGEYFGGDIRTMADEIYRRVEWDWMLDPNTGLMRQAWTEQGGLGGQYDMFSEANLLYLLAIGSPTHPIPPESFYSFARPKGAYNGPDFVFTGGGQIFIYQYSQAWYDFRNTVDYMGVNWWQNSIEGVRANQRWCADNSGMGYGQHLWGLTACDGPDGYKAYGARPCYWQDQDGTIAPTGIAGSVAIAPDLAVPSLKYLYAVHGDQIWKDHGFVDSFNLGRGWVDGYYLGIDQGIILLMLENLRSGMVWQSFMQNEHVIRSLERAGFSGYGSPVADVTLENFEDQNFWTPDTSFGWWETDGSLVYQRSNDFGTVAEGGVSMRLAYSKNGMPWSLTAGHIAVSNPKRDFSNHDVLTMKVFGACEVLLKLRDQSLVESDVGVRRAYNANGWNRLTFDLGRASLNPSAIDNVMLFVDPGQSWTSGVVFIDDIKLEAREPVVVEDFEDGNFWTPESSLGWWDIDGTIVYRRIQSKDPSLGGFGAMKIDYTKNGIPWSYFAGYLASGNPQRDFSGHTRLTVWVYGQGTVMAKLRDGAFREVELGTAEATNPWGWTLLEFDYAGVSTIDLSDVENILFFIAPGDAWASGSLIFDHVVVE